MAFRQESDHPVRCHGFLLIGRRANKKRGGGVCEADGFYYRRAAGPAGGQRADKRIARAVRVDQFYPMSGFRVRCIPAFGRS